MNKTPHEWSKDAFLNKAQRYVEEMSKQDRDSWQFGFWSALSLEMLTRAALAQVSPTLIADNKNWNHILYALGKSPIHIGYIPKSAHISDILKRIQSIFPEKFTQEMANSCSFHFDRRNKELHGGHLPFDALKLSEWLAQYYAACQALLDILGKSMAFLFGEETETAMTLIQGLKEDAKKSVEETIRAYQITWNGKNKEERGKLTVQAELLASRQDGHRTPCPACQSVGLLQGTPTGKPNQTITEAHIIERQRMLPAQFICGACDLKIAGYSKLNACGLGEPYTSTITHNPIDYFDIDFADLADAYADEDNNEP